MKRTACFLITAIFIIFLASSASGAGYTLLEKAQRQLIVGSGLKGSVTIRGNADPGVFPFLHAIQNASYEARGIQSGENLHYYVYQAGEQDERFCLTEFSRLDGKAFLRSDLLEESVYALPDLDHLIGLLIHTDGENASVLPELLRMIRSSGSDSAEAVHTDSLEMQLEMWMTGYAADASVESADGEAPRLTQVFRIPVAELYHLIAGFINLISQDDSTMKSLRSFLSEEKIALYLNPNLAYFYEEAMNQLDLSGEIVFSRTVSTLGDPLMSSLVLPLDETKTGYASLLVQNDERRKSFLLSGQKGVLMLDVPEGFSFKNTEMNDEILFAYTNTEGPQKYNLSLRILIQKTHEEYEDTEESRNHEKDHYAVTITGDPALPAVQAFAEIIPEFSPVSAEIDLHFSSKLKPQSPTLLDLSIRAEQGAYFLECTGQLKTAAPWAFSPFSTDTVRDTNSYSADDFKDLQHGLLQQLTTEIRHETEEILIRVSDEINTESDAAEE